MCYSSILYQYFGKYWTLITFEDPTFYDDHQPEPVDADIELQAVVPTAPQVILLDIPVHDKTVYPEEQDFDQEYQKYRYSSEKTRTL